MRRPSPDPCGSCPYRRDVPSGVWAASEYVKLPPYDRPTAEQPLGMFQCHQNASKDPRARVCGGWAAVHGKKRGHELISLRLAEAFGHMSPADLEATASYTTTVPLWPSGLAAAAHGMGEIDRPSIAAGELIAKVQRRRPEVTVAHRCAACDHTEVHLPVEGCRALLTTRGRVEVRCGCHHDPADPLAFDDEDGDEDDDNLIHVDGDTDD